MVGSQKTFIYVVLCALHVVATDSGPRDFEGDKVFDDVFKENLVKQ